MKYFIIVLFLLYFFSKTYAQSIVYPERGDSSVIKIRDYYAGYGKIFYNFSQVVDNIEGAKKEMEVSISDVVKAEKILFDNYNEVYRKDNRFSNFNYQVKNPKKYLFTYYRQYFGFHNESNDRVVVIFLMNFKEYKKAKDYFINWKNEFAIGNGDFYEKNQKIFLVNLNKRNVTIP
jgi:hypothetical protein